MVIISCSGKFHAFNLAEQLEMHNHFSGLWTTFAQQKNHLAQYLVNRRDTENIPIAKIHTCIPIAAGLKIWSRPDIWNDWYDQWVALSLKNQRNNYQVFIGWSGMSSHSIKRAKRDGKLTIVERGSSHILFQNNLLREEYKKNGIDFAIHPRIIQKELEEYKNADFISIPSTFVRNTFISQGVPESKLLQNPYGCSTYLFKNFAQTRQVSENEKFKVLYLGKLSIRKGLIYHFQALESIQKTSPQIEPWFIGSIDQDFKKVVSMYSNKNPEWRFFGHIPQSELPKYLNSCDIAVHPSLEEGLSMVIPQLLASGIPVIATTNTGGEDIIEEGKTGFIVPIRDPNAIAEKLLQVIESPDHLVSLRQNLAARSNNFTWEQYGNRWADRLTQLTHT